MAQITRYPFVRHLRGSATTHVRHVRRGRLVHEGVGVGFWFRPLSAVLSEIPVDDRELPLLFHARTADFQDVTVQATVTYRFARPALAAARVDFGLDPASGTWTGTPLDQVAALLVESAQQHALDLIARSSLADVLAAGVGRVRDAIGAGLLADTRLAETGIAVLGVRVVAIRPEPDVEKALRTPTRERVQADADRASFERRATAVEHERAISENELQNQIELARREENLVDQRGANQRRAAEQAARTDEVALGAETRRTDAIARATAEATRVQGEAEAAAETAHLAAYRDLPTDVLTALAIKELAANLPRIEHLTLTPDLLAPVLARLGQATS